jgi:hypothetical protein
MSDLDTFRRAFVRGAGFRASRSLPWWILIPILLLLFALGGK